MEPSLYIIKAILLLDNDGNRLIAKYYDNQFASVKEEKTFEKSLFTKTHKANGEIIMLDGLTIVYRSNVDLYFYVIGSTSQNEIVLNSVLNCFYESISLILRKHMEKKHLLDNMDSVVLAIDEICDNGILLETDPSNVAQRVCLRDNENVSLGDQTVFDVLRSARDQIKTSVFK